MKQNGERRSIFRKGKGRAFLKFLLGELLLVALVCVGYLFLLQGDVSALLPAQPAALEPTASPEPSATPAPTPVQTIAPTGTPTPAPTGTPIPLDQLSLSAGETAPEVPAEIDEALKLGMSELRAFNEAGQKVVIVSGYAYIEGLDAANSSVYLLISNAANAEQLGLYPAVSAPEMANLSFEESSGENLTNAFFTAKLDVSEFGDGSYTLSVVVVNEDRAAMNVFDSRTFHFTVWDGVLAAAE